jgi:hypothetical protein
MNTYFKKIILLVFAISISPISKAMDDLHTKKASILLKKMAHKIGLNSPIKIKTTNEICYLQIDLSSAYNKEHPTHLIGLPENDIEAISQPWYKRIFNPEMPLLKAFIYHELGHANFLDKKSNRFLCMFTSTNEDRYNQELFADDSIPNEKDVLTSIRDDFQKYAHRILRTVENSNIKPTTKQPFSFEKLHASISIPLDSTSSFDEETAQEWDNLHAIAGDEHPSFYRRSHRFNERLKILEEKEKAYAFWSQNN